MWLVTPVEAFCSPECAFSKDSERIRSHPPKPEPDELKLAKGRVHERDGVCVLCGSRWFPHVHHVIYRSEAPGEPWLHTEANLILLCEACHDIVHADKDKYQPKLLALLERMGYDVRHEQVEATTQDPGAAAAPPG